MEVGGESSWAAGGDRLVAPAVSIGRGGPDENPKRSGEVVDAKSGAVDEPNEGEAELPNGRTGNGVVGAAAGSGDDRDGVVAESVGGTGEVFLGIGVSGWPKGRAGKGEVDGGSTTAGTTSTDVADDARGATSIAACSSSTTAGSVLCARAAAILRSAASAKRRRASTSALADLAGASSASLSPSDSSCSSSSSCSSASDERMLSVIDDGPASASPANPPVAGCTTTSSQTSSSELAGSCRACAFARRLSAAAANLRPA